jgi:arsenate reductase
MAEGFTRYLGGGRVQPYSAGVAPGALDPRAVEVMAEVGIDISRHDTKHLSAVLDVAFDLVVTVCDHAAETCPIFPGPTEILHRSFEDPPRLAASATSEEEALSHYRRVRDEIRVMVEELLSRNVKEGLA